MKNKERRKKMLETKIEVEDLFLRYRDHTKGIKELSSKRAIIIFDEHGIEREISVPKNENCNVSAPCIEVLSMLYIDIVKIKSD